jgi:hypothetical protein
MRALRTPQASHARAATSPAHMAQGDRQLREMLCVCMCDRSERERDQSDRKLEVRADSTMEYQ